ncbi:hypothetical protein JCM17960_20710 [Magnetospira thiophila]
MDSTTAYRPLVALSRQPFQTRYLAAGEHGRPLVVVKRFEVGPTDGDKGPPPPTAERVAHMRRAFVEEILLLRRFEHPHIIPLLGANEDGDSPFMLLPLLPLTLRDLIWAPTREGRGREPSRLPLDSTFDFLRQVLDALEEVHGRGVVHRQLAPGAMWLAADGRLVLDGFGLAKTAAWDVFPPGTGGGPQGFASPEQLADATQADARSDIYAFGCIGYRLACGRLADGNPLSPSEIDPTISRTVGDWLMACMAPRPEDRPQTLAEVRAGMEAVA